MTYRCVGSIGYGAFITSCRNDASAEHDGEWYCTSCDPRKDLQPSVKGISHILFVCVPRAWSDEEVEAYAHTEYPLPEKSRKWRIRGRRVAIESDQSCALKRNSIHTALNSYNPIDPH